MECKRKDKGMNHIGRIISGVGEGVKSAPEKHTKRF